MSLASEIERLTDLHRRGALSDEEFAHAKAAILTPAAAAGNAPRPPHDAEDRSLPRTEEREREERRWAMVLHLSLLSGFLVPLAGFVVPVLLWQWKKEGMPSIDAHGKVVVNWMISALIYGAISGALVFVLVGIPLLIVLGSLTIVFPILGGIKAREGVLWPYPLTIRILR